VSRPRQWLDALRTTVDLAASRSTSADLAIFHHFRPAPYGGANQFLLALSDELCRRGLVIEQNRISVHTRACLYNSFNFDFDRLRRFARRRARMVHRVDGPIGVYRGADDGTDRRIWQVNHDVAHATIFQSQYSLRRHQELGLTFVNPTVIHNAADPAIFNATGRAPFSRARPAKLIAVSWSDNPNKGAETYAWLEQHLDWTRFEFTFVGRSQVRFDRARAIPPVGTRELAALLREHDIFITASLHESCSNSLVEALSCGLPAIYVDSGSNGELAGAAGFSFTDRSQIPALLDRLVDEYEARQRAIDLPTLSAVADRYLEVLGLGGHG
jgi:glycosyltransferase involved in cell wall biosynthesis